MQGRRARGQQGLEEARVLCYVCFIPRTVSIRWIRGRSGKERSILDGIDGRSDEHRKSSKARVLTFACGVGPKGRRELISGSSI